MIISLTENDRLNFRLILPIQGSLDTLERVERILETLKIDNIKGPGTEKVQNFDFKDDDVKFLQNVISILDQSEQLNYQALSVIKKILKIEYKE